MASSTIPATVSGAPVNIDEHNKDLAKRQAVRDKNRAKHLRCLDPITASQYENRKPVFEWKIECELFRRATKSKRAGTEKFCEQVIAQNADDAWAMFCDKIGEWPSRRDVQPKITKVGNPANAD